MPRSRHPEKTRENILASALEIFANKGFALASMDEIAKSAGVTKGALYWHFDGKLALYRALVDYTLEMQMTQMAPAAKEGASLREMVEELVRAYIDFYRENELVMAFYSNMMMERNTLSESGVMVSMAQAYRSYREAVASTLAKGRTRKDPGPGAAAVLIGALDGIMMQWMMDPEGFDLDGAGKALVELFSGWGAGR